MQSAAHTTTITHYMDFEAIIPQFLFILRAKMQICKYGGLSASLCCEKEMDWGLFNQDHQAKMPVSPTTYAQSCKAEHEVGEFM